RSPRVPNAASSSDSGSTSDGSPEGSPCTGRRERVSRANTGGEALMLKRVIIATALLSLASPGLQAQGRGGQPAGPQKITAIRAGRLIDPETGAAATNQIIVIAGERIRDVGPNVAVPAGAEVIDLSGMTVLPDRS